MQLRGEKDDIYSNNIYIVDLIHNHKFCSPYVLTYAPLDTIKVQVRRFEGLRVYGFRL